jgi:hypothetical protein
MASPLLTELLLAVAGAQQDLKDEDVTAGWTAFAIFLLLIAAVALLGFSLTKRLKNAQAAEDAGLYGSDATETEKPEGS